MFVRRVYLSNFRSFGCAGEFIDLNSSVNILVGRNDTGKTNFIDALGIVLGNKSPYQIFLDEKDYNDPTKPIYIDVEIADIQHSDLFKVPLSEKQRSIVAHEDPEGELVLGFYCPPHLKVALENAQDNIEEESEKVKYAFYKVKKTGKSDPRIQRKVFDIRRAWIKQIVAPSLRDPADYLNPSKVYYPFSMLLQELITESDKKGEIKKLIDSASSLLDKVFSDVSERILKNARSLTPFDAIRFGLAKEGRPEELTKNISLFLKLNEKEFEISQVGTGTQSAMIIAILEAFLASRANKAGGSHKLFIVEEPEIYIHPHAIRRVAGLLRELSEQPDFQIIITTHSPDFALIGMPFDIFRFNLIGNQTKIEKFDKTRIASLGNKANREIKRSNSEMFFAKSVLLVEGETEEVLLPVLAKNYTPQNGKKGDLDLDRYDVSVISMGSKDNFSFYFHYLTDIGIKCYFLFDGDISDETLSSLIKVYNLEIDKDKRSKAIKALDEKGVHILKVNEIEDFYSDKLLAKIRNCSEDQIREQIENEMFYDKRELSNLAIKRLIKSKQDDILEANMDVEISEIDKWFQEAEKTIRAEGTGGKRRRGKAIKRIFADMGKVQLGRAIAELMVKDSEYPPELLDFIARVCRESS